MVLAVWRTEDGGKTWSAIKSNLPAITSYPSENPVTLTFFDPADGFLWLGGPELWMTTDGGSTGLMST